VRRRRGARPIRGKTHGKNGGGLRAALFFILTCLHYAFKLSTLCSRILVRSREMGGMEVDTVKLKELRRRRVLSMRELEELSGVSHNTIWSAQSLPNGDPDRFHALYVLAVHAGMRPGELAPPKTAKSRRRIQLTAGSTAALKAHRKLQLEERMHLPLAGPRSRLPLYRGHPPQPLQPFLGLQRPPETRRAPTL
jgi:transcriptional regulator with XRE-family HTH domain